MSTIGIMRKHIEEVPEYYDFTKNDFMGECPGMAKLNYDPFPDKQPNDVVRSEIICRKLVLRASLKGDGVIDLNIGDPIPVDGKNFGLVSSECKINTSCEANSTSEIEAVYWLEKPEPMKILAQLRQTLAAGNK